MLGIMARMYLTREFMPFLSPFRGPSLAHAHTHTHTHVGADVQVARYLEWMSTTVMMLLTISAVGNSLR